MTISASIIGNGAIGALLKARCVDLGVNFNVISRADSKESVTFEYMNGDKLQLEPNSQTLADGEINDVIIIPVKAYQVNSVVDELKPKLSPESCLVMLHNGMGTKEIVQDKLPTQPVVLATTSHAAYKVSKSHIKQTGIGQSQYGWLNKGNLSVDRTDATEQLLQDLLQPAIFMQNMQIALWKKLAVNAAINPITATLKIKNGQLKEAQYQHSIEAICEEVSLVAALDGLQLNKQELVENVYQVITDTAENFSSMVQDITAKRRTEVDSINGYIVARAKDANITVTENKKYYEQIRALERTFE